MATDFDKIIKYAMDESYIGLPENYSALGAITEEECGDTLAIGIYTERAFVHKIGYAITESACMTVRAAAAAACSMADEKAVIAGYTITPEKIAAELSNDGRLDEEHYHCAVMASAALRRAVVDFANRQVYENSIGNAEGMSV